MARIVIMTIGSYGDVVPYLGLGERLRAAGHDVRIAATESSAGLVAAAGLDFHGLPGVDLRAVAATPEGQAAERAGLRGTAALIRTAADAMRRPIPAMIEAAGGQDIILCTPATVLLAAPIAEARGVPCSVLALQPIVPTRAFGPIALGGRNLGGWLNKVSAELLGRVAVRMFAGTVRTLRADLGLGDRPAPGRGPADLPVLHGISPAILPRPADYGPGAEFAGCWWPRASAWAPPPELERFLTDGPAPVCIGFGSAGTTQGPRLSAIVSDALGRSGHRAVVQRGWAGLAVSGPDVLVVDEVPHEWLFPRVAAVVHHSGAGTTAAGLRYGRPAVAARSHRTSHSGRIAWSRWAPRRARSRRRGCAPTGWPTRSPTPPPTRRSPTPPRSWAPSSPARTGPPRCSGSSIGSFLTRAASARHLSRSDPSKMDHGAGQDRPVSTAVRPSRDRALRRRLC